MKFPRVRFSIRTMMTATAVIAALLFWFLAEYEFTTTVSSATSASPDGKYTLVVQSLLHKSILREYRTVESKVYINSVRSVGMINSHHLGTPIIASNVPADFETLGIASIHWDADSKQCKYHVTDKEQAVIQFQGNRLQSATIIPLDDTK